VATAHSAAQIVAHLDEINVVQPTATAAHALDGLFIAVCIADLNHVAFKIAAHSLSQDMAVAAAAELGVHNARDGLVVTGASKGTDLFVRDFMFRRHQDVRSEIDHLVDLPHCSNAIASQYRQMHAVGTMNNCSLLPPYMLMKQHLHVLFPHYCDMCAVLLLTRLYDKHIDILLTQRSERTTLVHNYFDRVNNALEELPAKVCTSPTLTLSPAGTSK
jgi:hypothetical protein